MITGAGKLAPANTEVAMDHYRVRVMGQSLWGSLRRDQVEALVMIFGVQNLEVYKWSDKGYILVEGDVK